MREPRVYKTIGKYRIIKEIEGMATATQFAVNS
jgi:hypothetical protein